MFELKKDEMHKIIPLCEGNEQSDVWACIQGYMGKAFVDEIDNPKCAKLLVADFCYLFGCASDNETAKEMVIQLQEDCKGKIIDAKDKKWGMLIEEIYEKQYRKFNRYTMKADMEAFDIEKLRLYAENIPGIYSMKRIDEELYHKVFEKEWTLDLCSNFSSPDDFLSNGIGYVVVLDGEIVSGASSYSRSQNSIDITIGTEQEHRRKGLALACASKLILECLQQNICPGWEAANADSVALAEKLGYTFIGEYPVYMI